MLQLSFLYLVLVALGVADLIPKHERVPIVQPAGLDVFGIYYTALIERRDNPSQPSSPICSGVAISAKLVLTVCFNCLRNEYTRFLDSEIVVSIPFHHGEKFDFNYYAAQKVYRHPECVNIGGNFRMVNNIGIIHLETEIDLIQPKHFAAVPKQTFAAEGWNQQLRLTNVRLNFAARNFRETLWDVETRSAYWSICRRELNITAPCHYFFCVGYHHDGSPSCDYDIGCPLSVEVHAEEFAVIGLLTKKIACGAPRSMAAFVQISIHEDWIRDIAKTVQQNITLVF